MHLNKKIVVLYRVVMLDFLFSFLKTIFRHTLYLMYVLFAL